MSRDEGKMLNSEETPDLEGTNHGTKFPYHSQGSHSTFLLRNQQNLEISIGRVTVTLKRFNLQGPLLEQAPGSGEHARRHGASK